MAQKIKTLTKQQAEEKLKTLTRWELNKKGTSLSKTFNFGSFISGLAFVARIAVLSEVVGHHPDIELSYEGVKVILTTHDVKGLTSVDFELARKIDGIKVV